MPFAGEGPRIEKLLGIDARRRRTGDVANILSAPAPRVQRPRSWIASITATALRIESPIPTAITNGRYKKVRFQVFGYKTRCEHK